MIKYTSDEDLTIIYYTANEIPEFFANRMREYLIAASKGIKIISVSQKPLDFGENIVVDFKPSHLNIYRQMLIGAKAAKTKYIAFAEDDMIYSPSHFKYRPSKETFAYNIACWGIYTWIEPSVFSYKGRRNNCGLICEREIFILAMEERFAQWPDDKLVNNAIWAEPGKYESQLGVTTRLTEEFYSVPPNIVFSHDKALSWHTIGKRKRLGEIRAIEIPYWGKADKITQLYV